MADLPAKPSLDHLRRQARDLLRAARAGDTTAAGRVRTELGRDPGLCTRVYVWTRAKGATGRSAY
jgi:hypothetical protein